MRVVKFVISGGSAFVVHIALMYFFTEFLGWHYLISATVSFVSSIAVGFSMNKFWTFVNSSIKGIPLQLSLYIVINLFNLGLNVLLLYVLVEFMGVWYIFAQAIVSMLIALESFFLYSKLFHQKFETQLP